MECGDMIAVDSNNLMWWTIKVMSTRAFFGIVCVIANLFVLVIALVSTKKNP